MLNSNNRPLIPVFKKGLPTAILQRILSYSLETKSDVLKATGDFGLDVLDPFLKVIAWQTEPVYAKTIAQYKKDDIAEAVILDIPGTAAQQMAVLNQTLFELRERSNNASQLAKRLMSIEKKDYFRFWSLSNVRALVEKKLAERTARALGEAFRDNRSEKIELCPSSESALKEVIKQKNQMLTQAQRLHQFFLRHEPSVRRAKDGICVALILFIVLHDSLSEKPVGPLTQTQRTGLWLLGFSSVFVAIARVYWGKKVHAKQDEINLATEISRTYGANNV